MQPNIGDLMKQAQQMGEEMKKAQAELVNLEVMGESGGGLVKVILNGKHEAKRITIDDSLLDDKEMLEDLIAAAINSATHKVAEASQNNLADLTSGIELPAGFKMPF